MRFGVRRPMPRSIERRSETMNKVPPIGAHVEYVRAVRSYVSGRETVERCVGVVLEHFPVDECDANGDPMPGKVLPEREWHVELRPDVRPEWWIDVRGPDGRVISDSFAPQVRVARRSG